MWRHLRMLKRGGRAYDKTGVEGTSPGELAVLCLACPIPSVNLPLNWKSAGKETEYVDPFYTFSSLMYSSSYLYYLTLGIDACFQFKRRQVSSYQRDPELGPGYAYLVAWDSYSKYLHHFTNQEEVCSCYSQRLPSTDMHK